MPRHAGALLHVETGTRFQIYAHWRRHPRAYDLEKVSLEAPPGTIKAGPADEAIYVVDAKRKQPYTDENQWRIRRLPPYPRRGARYRAARPDRQGHFDRLRVGTRAFSAASAFATVRCVLRIWEHYFGRRLPWFFRDRYSRLELIPRAESGNAWSGEGFLEFGFPKYWADPPDRRLRFCDLFDAVAHETGHLILKQVIGNPTDGRKTLEYRAHEEGSADLIAMIAALHLDSVVDRVLWRTRGRLFSENELSRISEYGRRKQVRELFNHERMFSRRMLDAVADYSTHRYSLPFSGAAFDIFVAMYLRNLEARGIVERRSWTARPDDPRRVLRAAQHRLERRVKTRTEFGRYRAHFKDALLDARDSFARMMARAWRGTPVDGFSYEAAAANIIAADRSVNDGRHGGLIGQLFAWRRIFPARSR